MAKKSADELKEIGARFKSVRALTHMPRTAFCRKYGMSNFTVQAWELGRNGTKSAGINLFCEALLKEDVYCTPEWLIDGEGIPPYRIKDQEALQNFDLSGKRNTPLPAEQERIILQKEIESFRRAHREFERDVVVIKIDSTEFPPHFEIGDYVGGRLMQGEDVAGLIGKICIVQVNPGTFLVRKLLKDGDKYFITQGPSKAHVLVKNFAGAASIIWHRKPIKSN